MRGQSQSSHDRLAKSLGYFSIALGVAELIAPDAVARAAGVRGLEPVVRAYGAREIATVATGLKQDNEKKENSVLALAALAAVTVVDVICASGLSAEKGGVKTALADYTERSGYPGGLRSARGAASDFRVPDDFRIPDPLRPYAVS